MPTAEIVTYPDSGKLGAYVSDFPVNQTRHHPKCVTLPHLGASTEEAEENCAIMVADQLRDFLENGNIRNSVNFPEAIMPPVSGATRLCIANANVPNMVGQISTAMAHAGLNIHNMVNKSRGEMAYTLVDVDSPVGEPVLKQIAAIDGVLGPRTRRAIEEFQRHEGLTVTGIPDAATRDKLEEVAGI